MGWNAAAVLSSLTGLVPRLRLKPAMNRWAIIFRPARLRKIALQERLVHFQQDKPIRVGGELREKLHAWRKELVAPMPTKNTAITPTGPASKPKRKSRRRKIDVCPSSGLTNGVSTLGCRNVFLTAIVR